MGLGSEIQDPEKIYSRSRIQGSKRHRIPDTGFATLKKVKESKDKDKQVHITTGICCLTGTFFTKMEVIYF
jgi:hypothetical protein